MQACVEYCERRQYAIVALVLARTGGHWEDVDSYIKNGCADVAVVADRDQVPVGPRIEAVVDDPYWTDQVAAATPRPWAPGRPEMLRRRADC